MSLPGGIRLKLALALFAIVGGALLGAFLIVVPSLEQRLVAAKLEGLRADAEQFATSYLADSAQFSTALAADAYVSNAAGFYDSRIVVFGVLGPPLRLSTVADSAAGSADRISGDAVALEAARTGRTMTARVRRGNREYGEAAAPLFTGRVILLSASLADQLSTVRLVERRLLSATVGALAIAAALGLSAAAMHARRIRRLQRAADRIAQGHFDDPIVDHGDDELGQLARSFDRMRVQLAQLDRARKEFVANASHELRTPLFSLAGFLELLADEELDEATRREFLSTTRSQVERLTQLATDLLDLSRMDAGRLRVEREGVSLDEVARVLAEELRALAEASGHVLEVDAGVEAWALADEERVLQIGRALAGNSLLHTPAGTHVTIRAAQRGARVALLVEDDGPGIPGPHLERIFDRFYRVEGGHASGSGLGLAIARELAERMAGAVAVESRPGHTVFTLELPAEPVTGPATPVAATV